MEITGTTTAWLTHEYTTLRNIKEAAVTDANRAVSMPTYTSNDMTEHGWVKVGTATITVTLDDPDKINAAQVEALRKEQHHLRAVTEMKLTQLEGRIQSLLCLEHMEVE